MAVLRQQNGEQRQRNCDWVCCTRGEIVLFLELENAQLIPV